MCGSKIDKRRPPSRDDDINPTNSSRLSQYGIVPCCTERTMPYHTIPYHTIPSLIGNGIGMGSTAVQHVQTTVLHCGAVRSTIERVMLCIPWHPDHPPYFSVDTACY